MHVTYLVAPIIQVLYAKVPTVCAQVTVKKLNLCLCPFTAVTEAVE